MELKDDNSLKAKSEEAKSESRIKNSFHPSHSFMLIRKIHSPAFTLAELMVILLVISLAMAAFLPVMTRRAREIATGELWEKIGATNDIHFGTNGATPGAAIGRNDFGGESARLLLNSDTTVDSHAVNHILFKQDVAGILTKIGMLIVDSNKNIGLGKVTMPTALITNTVAIGATANTNASASDSIAIGTNNTYVQPSTSTAGIAIGQDAMSRGPSAIGIGYFTMPYGSSSIAIGSGYHDWRTENTQATADFGIAIDGGITSGVDSIAIGYKSNASSNYAIAIGNASANNVNSLAIGEGATTSTHASAVAINSTASEANDTRIYQTQVGPNGMSVGSQGGLHSNWANAVGFGLHATNPAKNTIVFGGDMGSDKIIIPGKLSFPTNKAYTGTSEVCRDSATNILYKNTNVGSPCQNGSDRRIKNVNGEFFGGLDKIRQLAVYNYSYKTDKKKTPKVGVMAQDLMKVFPNAVNKNDKGYFMIRQEDMFYAMVNSIKQLDLIVQNLIRDFKSITKKVKRIDTNLTNLVKFNQANFEKIKAIGLQEDNFDIRISRLEKTIKNKAK